MVTPAAEPRCAVMGCKRRPDTLIEGDDVLTGAALPSVYSCDDPRHQYHAALAIMPPGQMLPSAPFGERVIGELARWNEGEAARARLAAAGKEPTDG